MKEPDIRFPSLEYVRAVNEQRDKVRAAWPEPKKTKEITVHVAGKLVYRGTIE